MIAMPVFAAEKWELVFHDNGFQAYVDEGSISKDDNNNSDIRLKLMYVYPKKVKLTASTTTYKGGAPKKHKEVVYSDRRVFYGVMSNDKIYMQNSYFVVDGEYISAAVGPENSVETGSKIWNSTKPTVDRIMADKYQTYDANFK